MPCASIHCFQVSAALLSFLMSTSMTQNPETAPVATPIIAFGHRFHQFLIVDMSLVASLYPRPPSSLGTRGLLFSGLHGKTDHPRCVIARASDTALTGVLLADMRASKTWH